MFAVIQIQSCLLHKAENEHVTRIKEGVGDF